MRVVSVPKRLNPFIFSVIFKRIMSFHKITPYIKYFFIPVFLFIHLEINIYPAEDVLETEHFKIFYKSGLLARAVNVSSELESINKRVSQFFEFDPLKKIELYLTEEKISFNSDYAGEDFYADPIFILSNHDYKSVSEIIEKKVFLIYYYTLCNGKENLPEVFNTALYVYYKSNPVFLDSIIADVSAICNDRDFDIGVISDIDPFVHKSIYVVFIDFIFSNYGKNIFLQILKDSNRHEAVNNLLSEISGETHNQINDKFRTYIRKKTGSGTENFSDYEIAAEDAVSPDDTILLDCRNDSMVQLKRSADSFYLSVTRNGTISELKIDFFKNIYCFTGLIFTDDDCVAVSALTGSGSMIFFYSIGNKKLKYIKQFTGFSITGINRNSDNKVIITANCNDEACIFSYDKSGDTIDLLFCDMNILSSTSIGDNIFFITKELRSEVKVFSRVSGKITSVFNYPGVIGGLNQYNSRIILSVQNEGMTEILMLDPATKKTEKIFAAKKSYVSPFINKGKIYFLSLVKNRIRLLSVNSNIYF